MRHALRWSTHCHRHSSASCSSCSWQNSRREILEAKSPSLSSTVNVERRGKQGEQYIDRRRRAVQWTWRFAPIPAPVSLSREIWRGCAYAVDGLPLNWAILSFLVKGIGWRGCAAISDAGLFAIRNGARREAGRACEELKTVRPGAATRERFWRVDGKSVLVSRQGCHAVLVPPTRLLPLVPVSGIPVRSVTRPGTRRGRHPD
jgi:hypothetical protein